MQFQSLKRILILAKILPNFKLFHTKDKHKFGTIGLKNAFLHQIKNTMFSNQMHISVTSACEYPVL